MPGYKANAKNTNIGISVDVGEALGKLKTSKGKKKQNLVIFIKDFKGNGNYFMDTASRILGIPGSLGNLNNHFYYSDYGLNLQYSTNENYTGSVSIIYYNLAKRIISGTLQFKAQNLNGSNDSVIVSDGRFDCKID